jgi:Asp-tRNA(Asn)/Glu-tRNA(Gln) amidotransferase A subunit family amidase
VATTTQPFQMTATELVQALRTGALSAVEALASVEARADEVAARVNPFAVRLQERARAAAEQADALLVRGEGGPLCGVPVTTKDSQWLAGVESTSGSLVNRGFVPAETAEATIRLEEAGAVIFATTTTPEFCFSGTCESPVHGITRNPWNAERTPGGSSGGAGAAVASCAGALSLGGDGGGSIRIPAAFCGVVGFKPTFGAVPREPCGHAWKTLVANGPLARTVADARLLFATVSGRDVRDPHSVDVPLEAAPLEIKGLRLVVCDTRGPLDDGVRRVWATTLALLEAAGAELVYDTPAIGRSIEPWAQIASADGWVEHAHEYAERYDELTAGVIGFLEFGRSVTAEQYVSAQFARDAIYEAYVSLLRWHGAAAVITPTLGCTAFPVGQRYPEAIGGEAIDPVWLDWVPYLPDANLAGLPALALPIGLADDGLPVSLQVLGLRAADATVLAVGDAIEQVVGFSALPAG